MRPELEEVLNRAWHLGFLGPGSIRVQARHAEAYLDGLPAAGLVIDLGSGGGVPGLVLADLRPDLGFVLVDSNVRRTAHLRWAVGLLGWGERVDVVLGRAEDVARGELAGTIDGVVARSFGPRSSVCECAAPLMRIGGRLVVSEPPERRAWPADAMRELGLTQEETSASVGVVVLRKVAETPARFPRAWRQQMKKPLF